MARFRAPANVLLRRAQLTLMLVTLLPTVVVTGLGITVLAFGGVGGDVRAIVLGILVIVFCATAVTGYILGSIYVYKGASRARFQSDFLNSVSHELRTPLTSISMFITALSNERLTDEAKKRECLELLDTEVSRLRALVERLLSLSRIEAGQSMLKREPVKVRPLVTDAVSALSAATLNDPVAVEIDLPEGVDDIAIKGDHEALAQALTNLLINAWKYSDSADREVRLSCAADDKFVEISVADNGRGIAKNEHKSVFQRFERGNDAVRSSEVGSGLGLAIVRAVAKAHKGRVDLQSRLGEGSTFRLRLRRWNNP